jgi:ATP-dependent Clp protease ATP-binding subunit ClpC
MNLFKSFLAQMAAVMKEQQQTEAEFSGQFTPRAREVFALAQDEATRLNHNFIGTEHVLLGLLKQNRGVAVNVLKRQGVDVEKVRTTVEQWVPSGPDVELLTPSPFTPRVKRVLVIAHKEARELNHTYVGTEHVLLGLLAERDGVAARVLEGFGLRLSQTRQEILKELDPNLHEGDQPSQA